MKNNTYKAIGGLYFAVGILGFITMQFLESSTGSFWDDVALNVYWMLALVIGFVLILTAEYKNHHQIGNFYPTSKY